MKKDYYFLNPNASGGLIEDFLVPAYQGVGEVYFAKIDGEEHSQLDLQSNGWVLVCLTEEKAKTLIDIEVKLRELEEQFGDNKDLAKAG